MFFTLRSLRLRFLATVVGLSLALLPQVLPVYAAEPGRGATAALEQSYLTFIIDHHFAALRMTELAAGTLQQVTGEITDADRARPTPGFEATEPRARLDQIKEIARRNNRMQREEILMAQRFLRDWYGVNHEPQVPASARPDIERLQTLSGEAFDRDFLPTFSRHHYTAITSSVDCLVGREVRHDDLRRFCKGAVDSQLSDIDEMRHLASRQYGMDDIQPQEAAAQMQHHILPAGASATIR